MQEAATDPRLQMPVPGSWGSRGISVCSDLGRTLEKGKTPLSVQRPGQAARCWVAAPLYLTASGIQCLRWCKAPDNTLMRHFGTGCQKCGFLFLQGRNLLISQIRWESDLGCFSALNRLFSFATTQDHSVLLESFTHLQCFPWLMRCPHKWCPYLWLCLELHLYLSLRRAVGLSRPPAQLSCTEEHDSLLGAHIRRFYGNLGRTLPARILGKEKYTAYLFTLLQ